MGRRPPRSTRTDPLFPYTTLFRSLPKVQNPPSGLIVNANNRLVDTTYPYAIAHDWEDPYRAARILDVIDERDELTMADNLALQNDIVSQARSEERRVGKECVRTCRSRWSPSL